MTAEDTFTLVKMAGGLPYVVAGVVFMLKRPEYALARGILAVVAAWLVQVAYTMLLYNPAGIAAGHAAGAHFPENSYDNNTTSIALFFGWLGPAILIAIMATFRAIRKRVGLRSAERTPNTSLERTRDR